MAGIGSKTTGVFEYVFKNASKLHYEVTIMHSLNILNNISIFRNVNDHSLTGIIN